VEVSIDSSGDSASDKKRLLVGYSADVEIVLDSHDEVLRIPTSTLLEGNKVLIYNAHSKKLEERAIQVGITNWEFTEVLSGLKQGDQIVASLEREGVKAGVVVSPEDNAKPAISPNAKTNKAK
jgi:HlyD family secretion protein